MHGFRSAFRDWVAEETQHPGEVAESDSGAVLIQKGGKPDRIVNLEKSRGAVIGERWQYYLRDKQVNFKVHDGRVSRVDEIR
ncbi:hypothetical protein H9645_03540 [Luteimonas sp. Sa2BVA3]|uniref:DUF2845 domain-containing protein n=1 Tax=Luteimonas colneyensis TaxID=2762230 RepID=A0ABR8UHF6_9GAMM|nr:hypothetical protein [Luteimonas colneyensis]MBD7987094.1 hypothetical protein [Luteimonas colneyensis]